MIIRYLDPWGYLEHRSRQKTGPTPRKATIRQAFGVRVLLGAVMGF